MTVTSSAFTDGGRIPTEYTGFGEDISPELRISGIPENTVTLAVILDDSDVPFCKIFTHWIIWNIPKTDVIPRALPGGTKINSPIEACQGRAYGKHIYRGPKQPPFIRNEHRYVFTVYALDCRLSLPENADRKALVSAMNGHILASGAITGIHKRSFSK